MRIKDWHKFQHFKDRRPPWVKLYRDLLDDMDWHRLDPNAAKALVSLWLIASESDGELPSAEKLAFRLRITEDKCKSLISNLSHWLIHDDDSVISTCYQPDTPETETETETETDRGRKAPVVLSVALPDWLPADAWLDWHKFRNVRKGWTPKARELSLRTLGELRTAGNDPRKVIEQSIERGWTGLFPLKSPEPFGKPAPLPVAGNSPKKVETPESRAQAQADFERYQRELGYA